MAQKARRAARPLRIPARKGGRANEEAAQNCAGMRVVRRGAVAAVGAASPAAAVGAPRRKTKRKREQEAKPAPRRAPRIWFEGKTIAVRDGQQSPAMKALRLAHGETQKWGKKEWGQRMKAALLPFRDGIMHGGHNRRGEPCLAPGEGEQGRMAAADGASEVAAAVGADAPAAKKGPGKAVPAVVLAAAAGVAPESPAVSSGAPAAAASGGARSPRAPDGPIKDPAVVDTPAAVGASTDTFRDNLRLLPPFSLVGSGTFGKVFRCFAVPSSAVGDEDVENKSVVAVKVMSKFEDIDTEQGQLPKPIEREVRF